MTKQCTESESSSKTRPKRQPAGASPAFKYIPPQQKACSSSLPLFFSDISSESSSLKTKKIDKLTKIERRVLFSFSFDYLCRKESYKPLHQISLLPNTPFPLPLTPCLWRNRPFLHRNNHLFQFMSRSRVPGRDSKFSLSSLLPKRR